jgi:thioredoxin-related protein
MEPSTTLVGKKLDIPGVAWNSSQISAVVFLSTECRYCEASMPFYRRLVSEHHQTASSGVALLAISLEPSEYVNKHLASEQVQFDHVYQLAQSNRLLRETPTFLIVDKDGIIQLAALGVLPTSKEKEMLQIVETGHLDSRVGL